MSVSRETTALLEQYVELLLRWNERIRLVGHLSRDDLLKRQIPECLLLRPLLRRTQTFIDIGSGSGLPIVVLAIVARVEALPVELYAVESDRRKASFLREAAAQLGLSLTVVARRVEDATLPEAGVVSGKAVASVQKFLGLVSGFRGHPTCVLLKGPAVHDELVSACMNFQLRYKLRYDSGGVGSYILLVEDHTRA